MAAAPGPQASGAATPAWCPIPGGPAIARLPYLGEYDTHGQECIMCGGLDTAWFVCRTCCRRDLGVDELRGIPDPGVFMNHIRKAIGNDASRMSRARRNVSVGIRETVASIITTFVTIDEDGNRSKTPNHFGELLAWVHPNAFAATPVPLDPSWSPMEELRLVDLAQLRHATALWEENAGAIRQVVGDIMFHFASQLVWTTCSTSIAQLVKTAVPIIAAQSSAEARRFFLDCFRMFCEFPAVLQACATTENNTTIARTRLAINANARIQQLWRESTGLLVTAAKLLEGTNAKPEIRLLLHSIVMCIDHYLRVDRSIAPFFAHTLAAAIAVLSPFVYSAPSFVGITQLLKCTIGGFKPDLLPESRELRGVLVEPAPIPGANPWAAYDDNAIKIITASLGDFTGVVRGLPPNVDASVSITKVIDGFSFDMRRTSIPNDVLANQNKCFVAPRTNYTVEDAVSLIEMIVQTPTNVTERDYDNVAKIMGINTSRASIQNTAPCALASFLLKSYGKLGLIVLISMTQKHMGTDYTSTCLTNPELLRACGIAGHDTPPNQDIIMSFFDAIIDARHGDKIPVSTDFHRVALDLLISHVADVYAICGHYSNVMKLIAYWSYNENIPDTKIDDDYFPVRPDTFPYQLPLCGIAGAFIRTESLEKNVPAGQYPPLMCPLVTEADKRYAHACYVRSIRDEQRPTETLLAPTEMLPKRPDNMPQTVSTFIANGIKMDPVFVDPTPLVMALSIRDWPKVSGVAVRPFLVVLENKIKRLFLKTPSLGQTTFIAYPAYDTHPELDVRSEPARLMAATVLNASMLASQYRMRDAWVVVGGLPRWYKLVRPVPTDPKNAVVRPVTKDMRESILMQSVTELCREYVGGPNKAQFQVLELHVTPPRHNATALEKNDLIERMVAELSNHAFEMVAEHQQSPKKPAELPFRVFIVQREGHFVACAARIMPCTPPSDNPWKVRFCVIESLPCTYNNAHGVKKTTPTYDNWVAWWGSVSPGLRSVVNEMGYDIGFALTCLNVQGAVTSVDTEFNLQNACGYITAFYWNQLRINRGVEMDAIPRNLVRIVDDLRRWLSERDLFNPQPPQW